VFDSKFTVALGGFFPRVNSRLSIDGPNGSGPSVDGNALGLGDAQATGWASFNWRFLPRHAVHLEYFQLDRDGPRTVDQSFDLGGTTIGVNAEVDSEMDLSVSAV
jgi:hypothetical protein